MEILRDLFPYPTRETCEYRECIAEAPAFTTKELEEALSNMKSGKAPGLDAIPLEAIKEATKLNGAWILKVLNELIKTQTFPKDWKKKGIKNLAPYQTTETRRMEILRDLFPYPTRETCEYRECIAEAPAFTTKELEEALSNMKSGKAPGLDAIPLEAIKEPTKLNGAWILKVLNELIKRQTFPKDWKNAKIKEISEQRGQSWNPCYGTDKGDIRATGTELECAGDT
ncbi:hypothetical protein QE152_g37156 [Popillia japonica]|uniref:RNA-directed DNA polymerase from mobile element jockey n=1 Tax=Popillia japonica TaxID=7064 RepID=A0AAW1IBF2_POPJA